MKTQFTILLSLLIISCGCNTSLRNTKEARNRIAILNDSSAGADPAAAESIAMSLRREAFEVDFLSAEEACDPEILSLQNYFLYVIPGTGRYPSAGEGALTGFIQQKGNLMVAGMPVFPWQPLLETISPGYKMYPMHDIASLKIRDDQGILPAGNTDLPLPGKASSCFRRPTGKGFECGYAYRWIPLISAHDQTGLERGTAAWMLINQAPIEQDEVFRDALRRIIATTEDNQAKVKMDVEGSVFAAIAIPETEVIGELAGTPLFVNIARHISQGVYLSHGGAREFCYWPGESMQLGATVTNYGAEKKKVDAIVRLTSKSSREVVFEQRERFAVKPGKTLKKEFGEIEAGAGSGGYQASIELLSGDEMIDRISYEIGMLSAEKEPEDAFVTAEGTDFRVNGKKWYPVGVNYWPRSAIATEQVDYLYHWLTPGYYDPEQIDDDLQRLEDMGCNFVAIRADYKHNRRTVLDFLRRCRNHNIFVYLLLQTHEVTVEPHYFEGIMMPFHFQEEKFAEFVEETRIANNPALLAWDLIWEPSNWLFKDNVTMFGWDGDPNFRKKWDQDWAEWIDERYGSLKNAEADWGLTVNRTPEGRITSPSGRQFEENGPWRVMVAAYRRFMGDLMNRQYNDACRKIRRIDPNHLISYRQGNLPPTDYTLTSTHKHVDFFSMEAYSFPPRRNGANKVGFVNRYLCFALENKPFMWNEYGYGGPWGKHTRHLDGEDIVYQFEYVDMVHREAYRNGANGIAPWWFPGGLRASERTDFGITTPEGTLRPSGESLKIYAHLYLTDPPVRPEPDTWMIIDPHAHSGGIWYITNHPGAEAYEKAAGEGKTLGIRTPGTGTTSADTPLLAVGNTKYNGNNPPKYLNAEFNYFKIKTGEGDWIEISERDQIEVPVNAPVQAMASVGNLQEATWLSPGNTGGRPGAVYLASTGQSGLEVMKAIDKDTPWHENTDFGGSFLLTEGITDESRVELQMTAEGRAWFGEKLEFLLLPVESK